MKIKILLLGVVIVLIAGISAGAFWWLGRPQVIVLDNGDKLTLEGVTYGKHHAPPGKKTTTAAARARTRGIAFDTANNALVVWIRQEHPANRWPQYQLYLYDKAGTACVGSAGTRSNYGGGTNEIVGVQFDSFPRRHGSFILRVQEWVPNAGQVLNEKHFVVSNPARAPFPKWTAEPLPIAKTDDDLSVTLTKLVSGADANFNRDRDNPDDAINKGVEAVFHVQQNGTNAVNWQPVSIATSDSTGNHQNAGCGGHWDGDEEIADYQFGLWPDEPAWKLRVEFSQSSGFSDSELWTVKNIPVQPGTMQNYWNWTRSQTNTPFAQTTINGVVIKIYPIQQLTDMSPGSMPEALMFMHTEAMPEGMRLTLLKLTDDQGRDISNWGWSTDSYGLRDMTGVTNVNLTVAVHQSHFFEFTVKPETEKP